MEMAWISSGASLMEVQKSQSFLTLSASWMARDTTAMPLAAVARASAIVEPQLRYRSLQAGRGRGLLYELRL